ncbi:MAG: Asp23/Gls24 family envelope stress response protein [Clostridia bacterium]|nr:Asp23/Gls24 family envelope stress response protein [Clostridia bacterium]
MEVYAFIGKTGTGKSYRALKVAHSKNIIYIIDDAILIKNNKVICGKSAKTEATKIASVKAAIFNNEDRRNDMIRVIAAEKPDKILILGTSDDMVERIASNLKLGEIKERIYIEDIASKEEIELARKNRTEEGKHVVPVPTFEIKEQFSGYFLDPLRIFGAKKVYDEGEKTIIRPTYSYLGNYYLSEKVVNNLVEYILTKINGISRIYKVLTNKYVEGVQIELDIEVQFGENIPLLSNRIRNTLVYEIEYTTGINVKSMNINVKGISMKK